tara:strand:- start:254 stop:493 length:240 start_codon:yes stop_codon:yes gene_type:complete
MTEQEDGIRLKDLLDIYSKEEYKEIIEILNRDQKRYHQEQLSIHGVVVPKGTLCDHPFDKVTYFMDNSAECECGANLEI